MTTHELEIQITTDPNAGNGQKNPTEHYADCVLDDAKAGFRKYRWDLVPNKSHPAAPTFLIIDEEQGWASHLSKGASDGKLAKFMMTTTGADGSAVYSSMEMVADGESSVLKEIYNLRAEYVMSQKVLSPQSFAMDGDPVDPDDGSIIVDHFVQALLQDVRARTPSLAYSRQPDDSFICETFGISETRIVLKKEFETDHSDKYTVSLEYPDGSEVISCMEVSERDVPSDLRELYNLVSQQYPETYKDLAVKDAERFICNMRYQKMLDRVLTYAIEPIKSDAPPGEGRWLVMDIIKAAPSPRVIARHLVDELNRRQGVLPESESIRIRELVESTINSIVHLKREPNGFTFTGRGVPMAHDKNNRPIRSCRWSSCLSRVANSWTTWPADVFGADVDMNSKTVLTRIATLIVAAVLCDQLK